MGPALPIIDIFEFGANFVLLIASLLDPLPKGDPLLQLNNVVVVFVEVLEDFLRVELSEVLVPEFEGFFLVDGVRPV